MTTYIKVEKEDKEKYKGSWAKLPELNRKIQSTLKKRNKLAAQIITGNIKVEKKETLFGYIYQCATLVLTHFILAMMVITAADQKTMRDEVKKRIFNTKEKAYYMYMIEIANSKMDDNEKAQSVFGTPTDKSIKQPTQLKETEIREAITFFADFEDEKETTKRFKDGKLTTQEYLDTNMISGTTEEKKKFYFTGLVPKNLINDAMTEIDTVITELVDANLLKDTRFLNADKTQKSGLEIYNILQRPSQNKMHNICYFDQQIRKLANETARNEHKYLFKMYDLIKQRDNAIEEYDLKLSHQETLAIVTTINNFGDEGEKSATKHAILAMDFKKFTSLNEFGDTLLVHSTSKLKTQRQRQPKTIPINQQTTARNKQPVKCLACEKNHYLSDCTNEGAKAALKERDPENYNKYIKAPKCKYGDKCTRDKCKFSHPKKKATCETIRANVNTLNESKKKWILDSGSTVHVTTNPANLTNIRSADVIIETHAGERSIHHQGDIGELNDVLLNTEGTLNIISLPSYLKANPEIGVMCTSKGAYTIPMETVRQTEYNEKIATMRDNLYDIDIAKMTGKRNEKVNASKSQNVIDQLHRDFGHIAIPKIVQMQRHGLLEFPAKDLKTANQCPCKGCNENTYNMSHRGHTRRDAVTRNAIRPEKVGNIHADIAFLNKESKFQSSVLWLDKKSRFTHAHINTIEKPDHNDMIEWLEDLKKIIEKDGHKLTTLRFDGEPSVMDAATQQWLEDHQIQFERNTSSEQNLAEPKIRRIREKTNKMMFHRNCPKFLEPFAWRYACQIDTIIPTDALQGRTPYQEYYQESPYRTISRVKEFGSIVYHRPENLRKQEPAIAYIFVGFDDIRSANYWLYNPKTQRITTVNEAKFVTAQLSTNWFSNILYDQDINFAEGHEISQTDVAKFKLDQLPRSLTTEPDETITVVKPNQFAGLPGIINQSEDENEDDSDAEENDDNDVEEKVPERRYPKRDRNKPDTYVPVMATKSLKRPVMTTKSRHETLIKENYPAKRDIKIPKNRNEMLKSEYKEEFLLAESIEIATLKHQKTITYVNEDAKAHKLDTRMIYDVKSDNNGNIIKFKARLVVLGYQQRPHQYGDTYASVAQWTTIVIMLVIGWLYALEIYMLDFKGAYLHAERPPNKPIYLKPIPGMDIPPGKMPYLNKSLYGTVDAGNLWQKEVHGLLTNLGYTQSKNDPCLFYKKTKETKTWIASWVDDLIIISNDPNIRNIKKEITERGFEVSHFSEVVNEKYIGVNIVYDKAKDKLTLDQQEYIEEMLTEYNMKNCNACYTPMTQETPSKKDTPEAKYNHLLDEYNRKVISEEEYEERKTQVFEEMERMKRTPYRNAIGSLSHLARLTRPDLQFATFYHARYQADPGSLHWKGIKRVMRCANGTKDYKLSAKRDAPFLWCGCDSDWGNDPDKSRSTTGMLVKVKNIVVFSKSRLQKMTAKSSTEAEIIALCDFAEEVMWIKYLLTDFDIHVTPEIFCDNKPAIQTIKRGQLSKGNKHIVRRMHFTKGYVDTGEIALSHIRSDENESDILTKALPKTTYKKICTNLFDM